MAKKRPSDSGMTTISVKMTGAFKEWLNRLAASQRDSSVQTIEKALLHYAEHVGFKGPVPRRTERR